LVAVCGLAASAASARAANFTWTGAAAVGEPKWSNGTNWGGTAPKSGSVGTLTFPVLTTPGCTAEPFSATCYTGENNVSGLEVAAISIHSPPYAVSPSSFYGYDIRSEAITLGAGGLSVSGEHATSLGLPITLGAPQTWSLEGPGEVVMSCGPLPCRPISGVSDPLALDLSKRAILADVGGDLEVGALTITGANPSDTGSAARENGELQVANGVETGALNATDGNPVHLVDAALFSCCATTGALASTGGEVDVYGEPGAKFTVAGAVTLDSASEMRFWIPSQLSASGPVNLANAHLSIWEESSEAGCPTLKPGDMYTLITTTGSLTGTFSGVPDGSTIALECRVETIGGTKPTVKINYTAHTVTATVQEPKKEEPPAKVELPQPASASLLGTAFALTATVTEAGVPQAGVPVTFTVTGANPQTGSSATDTAGHATFAYVGKNPGTDHIVASFVDKAGATRVSNEVTKVWAALPPPPPPSPKQQVKPFKLSAPVLGKTVNVETVSGVVYVKLPAGAHLSLAAPLSSAFESLSKGAGFIPLTEARQIPVGSTLDTTEGVARLTTATATVGKVQFGEFGAGIFSILQSRKQRGLTNLKIVNPVSARQVCASAGKKAQAARRRLSRKVVGLLNGSAKGKYTTTGQYSAATVRGTIWSVANRCDGTLTQVSRGVVSVRDFLRRKTITLRAGQHYLAKAP
jgi:hypothetical protein